MLPEGFKWEPRWQYARDELALTIDGEQVAYMLKRLNGTWFARIWVHRRDGGPDVTRDCRSRETGIAGCEAWVCRHEARLRAEVAVIRAGRRR